MVESGYEKSGLVCAIGGGIRKDTAGNNTLTFTNVNDTTDHNGRANRAWEYTTNDIITVAHQSWMLFRSGFSIEVGFYCTSTGLQRLVQKSETQGFLIRPNMGANNIVCSIAGGTERASAANSTLINTWNHAVVVINNAGAITFYCNGVQSGTPNQTSGALTSITDTGNLNIGNRATLDRTFEGKIDLVRIYNIALSASQITKNYNYYRSH